MQQSEAQSQKKFAQMGPRFCPCGYDFTLTCSKVKKDRNIQENRMANESCDPTPAPSEPVKPGTRIVKCVKFGKELPGLDRIPWQGELGKRVYENVSKDAWKLWLEYSKMVMNEYRLNPLDPNSQKIMGEQMEQFFFGEGAKLPEGYVPPKAKG
jgi:Fe-S cluster biosynthesis and repair protein YggX